MSPPGHQHRAAETRLSARRAYPSQRSHQRGCGGMCSRAPGSLSTGLGYPRHVRFSPDSGRRADIPVRQVRANGLMHPRKTAELIDGVGKAICWQLIRIYLPYRCLNRKTRCESAA
jgi:hypothetical protein